MNIWMPKKLRRLLFMFVLGVLLVNATYKVMMFGAMPTSDKKGKTPLSDLPTIVKHSMPAPTTYDFCFFCDIIGLKLRLCAPF